MDLGLHFEVQNREKTEKNDVENKQEIGDGKKAKKERKGVTVGSSAAGWRQGRRRPGLRIRREFGDPDRTDQ